MPRLLSALALAAILAPGALHAQAGGHDFAILEVASSTPAMAMGGAFDLSSRDSDGIFYNPATLVRATGLMLGVQRLGGAGSQATLSAATAWWDGGVGLGLQVMEWGGAAAFSDTDGLRRLVGDGPVPTTEWAASAGYAREILGPTVGVVAKLVGRRAGAERDVVAAIDVGLTGELGPLSVGLAVRNLAGEPLAGDVAGRVPERITLGVAASGFEVGPLDLGAAARFTRRADGGLGGGAGLEVAYWPVRGRTFIGRIGVQALEGRDASVLSFGAAFHGDALILEYAYRPGDAFGGVLPGGLHRVSLGWR